MRQDDCSAGFSRCCSAKKTVPVVRPVVFAPRGAVVVLPNAVVWREICSDAVCSATVGDAVV